MKKTIFFVGLNMILIIVGLWGVILLNIFPPITVIQHIQKTLLLGTKPSTEQYLKKAISIDYPRVARIDISDWERVNILRKWAAEHLPWSSEAAKVKSLIQDKEAPYIFNLFAQNKGGVDCGSAGYALMKLYKFYGFESYEYHYGNLNGWNHALTLVKINHKGKNTLVVEDAFFNTTYTGMYGEPVDFFYLLQKARDGKTKEITLVKDDSWRHPNIDNYEGKREIYYSYTSYFDLEVNLTALLIPRLLEGSMTGESTDTLTKKIQSLVVY